MKNKTIAGLLAIFLGGIGVHKFYLRQYGDGILYLLFCWTFIPAVAGIISGIRILSMKQLAFDDKYNDGEDSIQSATGYKRIGRKAMEANAILYDEQKYAEFVSAMQGVHIDDQKTCMALGHAYFEINNQEAGRSMFRKAFMTDGYKDEVRKNFGFCEHNAGNFQEAIKLLQEIEPDYIKDEAKYYERYSIPAVLGSAFENLGKFDLAIEAYKKAPVGKRELNKDLVEIIVSIGNCYEKSGKIKQAITQYNKALAARFDAKLDAKVHALTEKI